MAEVNEYLQILNEEQKAAVIHEGSPLLILAGAGSGKTRVITTKIAYLIQEKHIQPWQILSVTFTKKAANEMRERAVALEPKAEDCQIRTFHSFGSWFLRKYSEEAGLVSSFTVYDDDDMAVLVKKAVPSLSSKEAKLAAHQISLCKDYFLTPQDDLVSIGSEFDLNEIYAEYQKRLHATGNVDFGDLIMLPAQVMEQNPHIADEIHARFRVIMVDEYQDSNIAQYKLLQELTGEGTYVCVVGDDDQSIYHFRGAEVQNILSFPEKFPGTQIIRLERNYRSKAQILEAASLVVQKNSGRLGKTLIADRGEGGQPILAFLPEQAAECKFCADLIQKSVSGEKTSANYKDWAILYRTNAQSLGFEKEFLHRKIPYVVVGSLKFYEREEIKDALAYLSLCANPKDEISFRRVINKPVRGIGEKTQDKIMDCAVTLEEVFDKNVGTTQTVPVYSNLIETTKNLAPELSKKAREGAENFCSLFEIFAASFDPSKKLSDFVERVIQDSHLDEYHKATDEIEGTTKVQNLEELINSAVPYSCTMEGLLEFLDSINLDRTLALSEEETADNAVTLITLHNTKGLEYNRVIITGLEEGVFPRMDKQGADLEEERRLFYVGITRARDELYVTATAKRCLYGSWQFMRPSQFLKESAAAFKMIGSVPYGMKPLGEGETSGFNSSFDSENDELAQKWKKGTIVYHDDYGTGCVVSQNQNGEEIIIEVQFETGNRKKFLPKYQAKSLQIIKD